MRSSIWRQHPTTKTIHIGRTEHTTLCGERLCGTYKPLKFSMRLKLKHNFCKKCLSIYKDPVTQ